MPDTMDIISSPVIDQNGNIYLGGNDGYLYKINSSGNLDWRTQIQANATLTGSPALTADGMVYILSPVDSVTEKLVALNTGSGAVVWEKLLYQTGFGRGGKKPQPRRLLVDLMPSPVIDRYGIIYVATENGSIYAIAGRETGTPMPSDWPLFRHDAKRSGKFGGQWHR
jgi:outer membrane protein assembly factor BamB